MIVRFKNIHEMKKDALINMFRNTLDTYINETDVNISGMTLYIGLEDGEGNPIDFYEENGKSLELVLHGRPKKADEIRELLKEGVKNKDVVERLGVRKSEVSLIKKMMKMEGEL